MKIYIGIDPGVYTGYAEWNPETRMLSNVLTLQIFVAMDAVKALAKAIGPSNVYVFCENPNTWRKYRGTSSDEWAKKAQGAGSIKRDYSIWESYCSHIGVNFTSVSLQSSIKKLSAETFFKYTKWDNRTTYHSRDAAMIVFNKS